jgi:hypothetical protein
MNSFVRTLLPLCGLIIATAAASKSASAGSVASFLQQVKQQQQPSRGNLALPDLSAPNASLRGFPDGTLSKNLTKEVVEKELRRMLIDYAAKSRSRNSGSSIAKSSWSVPDWVRSSGHRRHLAVSNTEDFLALNQILRDFELPIEEVGIADLETGLGFNVTALLNGTCGSFKVEDIVLDYDINKTSEEASLAYMLEVKNVGFKCFLDVALDTGVLDISDKVKVKFIVDDTYFGVAIRVLGAPPQTAFFEGCKVRANIAEIQSSGGFVSNILNDLEFLITDIVRNEAGFITSLLCDLLEGFTGVIEELLLSLGDLVNPFLEEPEPKDPLELENLITAGVVDVGVTLVDFTNDDPSNGVGAVINTLVTNLVGQFTSNQVNTLIELNLLDENGAFPLNLTGTVLVGNGTCGTNLVEEIRRDLRAQVSNELSRRLQLEGLIDIENLLQVNCIEIGVVEIYGLNTFSKFEAVKILGKYTLQTILRIEEVRAVAPVFVDLAINNVTVQSTVNAGLDVSGIDVTASYLLGLDEEVVDGFTIGSFLQFENILPCVLSALAIFELTELIVTVERIGSPVVEGAISPGIDEFANTLLEGAVCAYQDLLQQAITNFAQTNGTEIANGLIRGLIESLGGNSTCPDPVIGTPPEDDSGISFSF